LARVVWFEAWRYQNEQAPVVALLHEMLAQLASYLKLYEQGKKMLSITIKGALLSLEHLTKNIGFQASKVTKAGKEWEEEHVAAALPSNTLREQLEAAIRGLLSGFDSIATRRILVVLIDDLDRRQPEAAYRLLEGLKIYLTLSNCVFVLGMNQRIVEDAIGQHVPLPSSDHATQDLRTERAGAYLEKLCQNVWRLPAVRRPKALLLSYLPDRSRLKVWLDAALGDCDCVPPNPRRIKGLANLLLRFQHTVPASGDDGDPDRIRQARLLFIVAYVYQFHHDLFRLWERYPEVYRLVRDWVRSYGVPVTKEERRKERQLPV